MWGEQINLWNVTQALNISKRFITTHTTYVKCIVYFPLYNTKLDNISCLQWWCTTDYVQQCMIFCNSSTVILRNTPTVQKQHCTMVQHAMQRCNSAMVQQCNNVCNSATLHHCNDATVQRCNSATVQWCNRAMVQLTVQQCNSATVQRWNGETVQRCNSNTVQRAIAILQPHNSTTVQQCNCAIVVLLYAWRCGENYSHSYLSF